MSPDSGHRRDTDKGLTGLITRNAVKVVFWLLITYLAGGVGVYLQTTRNADSIYRLLLSVDKIAEKIDAIARLDERVKNNTAQIDKVENTIQRYMEKR